MMKRLIPLIGAVALLVALTGCEQMFSFNAFASFATPSFPATADDVSSIITQNQDNPQGFIDSITSLTASDAFFRSLDTNPDTKAEVVEAITTELKNLASASSGEAADVRIQAAVLAVNVYFGASDAPTVVENVSNSLLGVLDGSISITSLSEGLDAIFSAALQGVPDAEVPGALDAMSGATDVLSNISDLLPSMGASSIVRVMTAGGTTSNTDIGPGEAMNWAISIAISTFLDEYRYYNSLDSDWNEWTFHTITDVLDNQDVSPNGDIMDATIADLQNDDQFIEMMDICGLADQFGLSSSST